MVSSEDVEGCCDSVCSFTTEMTTDVGSYRYSTAQAPQDTTPTTTPTHNAKVNVHLDSYPPVAIQPVSSRTTSDQLPEIESRREDQVELQPMPGVDGYTPPSWTQSAQLENNGYQYTTDSGPLEMLLSAEYCGKGLHYPCMDNSVEAESQLHTAVEGGGEPGSCLLATAEDKEIDKGWPYLRGKVINVHV